MGRFLLFCAFPLVLSFSVWGGEPADQSPTCESKLIGLDYLKHRKEFFDTGTTAFNPVYGLTQEQTENIYKSLTEIRVRTTRDRFTFKRRNLNGWGSFPNLLVWPIVPGDSKPILKVLQTFLQKVNFDIEKVTGFKLAYGSIEWSGSDGVTNNGMNSMSAHIDHGNEYFALIPIRGATTEVPDFENNFRPMSTGEVRLFSPYEVYLPGTIHRAPKDIRGRILLRLNYLPVR